MLRYFSQYYNIIIVLEITQINLGSGVANYLTKQRAREITIIKYYAMYANLTFTYLLKQTKRDSN